MKKEIKIYFNPAKKPEPEKTDAAIKIVAKAFREGRIWLPVKL
jgi:hypothetical protein